MTGPVRAACGGATLPLGPVAEDGVWAPEKERERRERDAEHCVGEFERARANDCDESRGPVVGERKVGAGEVEVSF